MTPTTQEYEDSIHGHIDAIDQKHDKAHERHSELIRGLGDRLLQLEQHLTTVREEQATNRTVVQGLERRKIEINNVRFTPAMVISIIALVASIIGGQKLATWGIADKQQETTNTIELIKLQLESRKQHEEDVIKLQDERAANVQRQITAIGGQVTMIDTKLNNLRESIAGRK